MQDLKETIGRNIRRIRKARGQTLKSLSSQIGFTYQQLSRIEHGCGTSSSTLERIADVLGVDISVLTKEPEEDLQHSMPQTKNYIPDKMYQAFCARLLDTFIKPTNDMVISAFMEDINANLLRDTVLMRNMIATHAGIRKSYQFTADELLFFVQSVCADFTSHAEAISKYESADDEMDELIEDEIDELIMEEE